MAINKISPETGHKVANCAAIIASGVVGRAIMSSEALAKFSVDTALQIYGLVDSHVDWDR